MLHLRQRPIVLHVPDTAGRYYVLQFVDAWSNNFAYVGHRPTGTAEGEFLLAPSGYDGEVPSGMRVVAESTWLPAPDGPFRPIMRMYEPRAEILDGTYQLPAIRRIT